MKENALSSELEDGQICWLYYCPYLNHTCYVFVPCDLVDALDKCFHLLHEMLSSVSCFFLSFFFFFFFNFLLPSFFIPLPFLNPELISRTLCFAVYPHSLGDCIQAQLLDMPFTLETPQVIFLAQVSPQISKFLHPIFLSHLHFKLNTCNTDP